MTMRSKMVLYINTEKSMRLNVLRRLVLRSRSHRYIVIKMTENGENPTLFGCDCREELKIWLDLMGFSIKRLLYDSFSLGKLPVEENGVFRSYEVVEGEK